MQVPIYCMRKMAMLSRAEQYSWEVDQDNKRKSQLKPTPTLIVMDVTMPNFSGQYKLAYVLDLRSQIPFDAQTYFIDAITGRIIKKISLHHDHGVPGSGKTKYYGEREFIVDSIGPNEYELHDPTRCTHGITVYNDGRSKFKSTTPRFDLENEDQDEVALDAHFMTAEYYDLLRDEFDWLGIDNENGSMNVAIHANGGADFINAFWDGDFAWFGDGNCNNGPLVTLEVLAHEFMHGIIDYTSQLIYSDESGAINESLADVMGHYMENELDPDNFSWSLGHSFFLVDGLEPFRVMDDPAAVGNPEYYKGPLWEDGADVHYNSSLGNLVYVALSDGKTGTNLQDEPYTVTGIGKSDAAKFLFFVNRHYLTESSNYNAYYEACLLASDEFFNGDAAMKENITQAWLSVGVPQELDIDEVLNLSINSTGFVESCDWGKYASAEFSITNSGTLPYTRDLDGYVVIDTDINGTNYNRRVELEDDIMPGESQSFTIDSFMILSEDFFFVDYDLYMSADNEGRDASFDYFFVTEFGSGDISVSAIVGELSCFQDAYELTFVLTNQSCEEIPTGEKIVLSLTEDSGNEVFSETIVLESDLRPGGVEIVARSINLGITETTNYDISIKSDNDPNDENDYNNIVVPILETLTVNYYNGFDTNNDIDDNGLLIETSTFGGNITQHNGSSKFFTTGFLDEAFGPLCLDPDDNWVNSEVSPFGEISALISACVDMDGAAHPVVHFDMVQYRNDFMSFASANSSSVRLTTVQDGVESHQIIAGLPEGLNEEFDIPLPANFKGSIQMKFLTQTGVGDFANDFLLYDVVMLDNLILLNTTSTDELAEDRSIQVYPNPVIDELSFSAGAQYKELSIYDVKGQQVIRLVSDKNVSSIDVSKLDAGYYVVRLVDSDGEKHQGKFIKI